MTDPETLAQALELMDVKFRKLEDRIRALEAEVKRLKARVGIPLRATPEELQRITDATRKATEERGRKSRGGKTEP